MRSKEPVRIGKAKVSKQIEALKKKAYKLRSGQNDQNYFLHVHVHYEGTYFPSKRLLYGRCITGSASKQSTARKKKKQYRENGQVKN